MSTNKSVDELAYEYCEKDQYPTGFSGFKAGFAARDSEVQALTEALACAQEALIYAENNEDLCIYGSNILKEALARISEIKKANGIL